MNYENRIYSTPLGNTQTVFSNNETHEYKKIIMAELLRAGVRDIDHIVKFSNDLADKMSKGISDA